MRPHLHGRHGDQEGGIRLRDLEPGRVAIIRGYEPTHQSYRSKLLALGLTRGTRIVIRNIAPLGDPVHISVRDFDMSLRRDEADALVLELAEDQIWGGPADGFGEPDTPACCGGHGAGGGRFRWLRRRGRERRHGDGAPRHRDTGSDSPEAANG